MDALVERGYEHGFVTDIETDVIPPGLDEDVIRFISQRKQEPEVGARISPEGVSALAGDDAAGMVIGAYPQIDFQAIRISRRRRRNRCWRAWTRSIRSCCGPTRNSASHWRSRRRCRAAVDAVFDSVSVATTFQELADAGDLLLDLGGGA